MPVSPPRPAPADDDERVPVFGTWGRIYAAVVLCGLAAMGLAAWFAAWSY